VEELNEEHSLWYSGFKFDFPGMDISLGRRALISALQAVPASPKWVRGLEEVPEDLGTHQGTSSSTSLLPSQENAFSLSLSLSFYRFIPTYPLIYRITLLSFNPYSKYFHPIRRTFMS